jgi:hypothetical protein
MSVVLKTYNFYLSTRERDQGPEVNNATWTLKDPLVLNPDVPSSFQATVKHATIPFSFFQWNQYTNTSVFRVERGVNTYTGTYTITESNYNALTFKNEFIDKITTSIAAVSGWTPSLTGTYNQATNKYTFSLGATTPTTTIYLGYETEYDYIDRGLGFIDSWSIVSGGSTTSDSMVNVNPSRNLYLWSNNLSSKNYEAIVSSMDNSTNLCVIPIFTLPSTYIVYDPPNAIINDLSNNVITSINLQIKSENIPYNLQAMYLDYSVVIQIQEITTNFILESRRKQIEEMQAQARATLEQQLTLIKQKEDLTTQIERIKNKEQQKISKLLSKQNAKLLKQQQKEEKDRTDEYKRTLQSE